MLDQQSSIMEVVDFTRLRELQLLMLKHAPKLLGGGTVAGVASASSPEGVRTVVDAPKGRDGSSSNSSSGCDVSAAAGRDWLGLVDLSSYRRPSALTASQALEQASRCPLAQSLYRETLKRDAEAESRRRARYKVQATARLTLFPFPLVF